MTDMISGNEVLLKAFLTLLIAFFATVIGTPGAISALKRLKFGQEVRDDGPEEHLKKQGTPTMGGAVFLAAILLASLAGFLIAGVQMKALQILFLTAGFGLIGFCDDLIKIKRHHSEGLKPKQKLIMQLILTLIFSCWVYYGGNTGGEYRMLKGQVFIPFTGNRSRALYFTLPAVLFIPFTVFVVLGTDNGVNFTDGLDGLCSTVTSVVAVFFMMTGAVHGDAGLSIVSGAVAGGLMGFLFFNAYPAKVFMGDTGALALGGFVASAAVSSGLELYIPVIGFIYMAEVISVIIQVTYYKKTGGKRFFKMAPIHHHFELLGHSETRIVTAFGIITALLCGAAFIGASW